MILNLIIWLAIGALAGWLAGLLMKGKGFGLLGNIIVGVIGSIVGGWLFDQFGAAPGGSIIGSIITAVVGAVALLFAISFVKKVT